MKRFFGCVAGLAALFTTFPLAAQTNWTGATSSDWYTSGNWSSGTPTALFDTTINAAVAQQPTIVTGQANAKAVVIGRDTTSSLTISNGGSLQVRSIDLGTAAGGNGRLTLSTNGNLSFATNPGTLNVAAVASATGTIDIGAPEGSAAAVPGFFRGATISGGPGTGILNFNHTSTGYVFAADGASITSPISIIGSVSVRQNAGVTTLAGLNSYSGGTTINGGSLFATGSAAGSGTVTLNAGKFGATGLISGSVVALGGTFTPGHTLTTTSDLQINGNLTWASGATFESDLNSYDTTGALVISGQLLKQGGGTFRWDFKNSGRLGTYTLATFSNTNFVGTDFSFTNLGAGLVAVFRVVTNNSLEVTVSTGNGPPVVSISAPSVTTTVTDPVTYTVTYSDTDLTNVTLGTADITLNTTGTAGGTVSVSGTGSTRTVTISNPVGIGTLSISIAAGTAIDAGSNLAAATGPSTAFTVNNGLVIQSSSTATATYATNFQYQITADRAVIFGAIGLPLGLGVNPTTGIISGIPVVVGNFSVTLTAVDVTNGTLTTKPLSLTIGRKAITVVGITVANKVYDGFTNATLNLSGAALLDVLDSDVNDVVLVTSGATGTFADANIGTGKTVTVTGLSLTGNSAAYYTLAPLTLTGAITGTPVAVTLSNLSQNYDGAPKPVTVTTVPGGLAVNVTYNGSTTVPTDAGAYAIVAVVNDATFGGSATGTLIIGRGAQTINFPALPDRLVSDPAFDLSATASSGLPISYSITGNAALSGNTVFLTGVGTVTVTATQSGSSNYLAASATRSFNVRSRPLPGIYFGTFAGDRSDAAFGLLLRPDNTGIFFGFLPNRGIALQTKAISVDQTGVLSATFAPVGSTSNVTLRGTIGIDGALNGSIDALGVTFFGTSSGSTTSSAGGPTIAAAAREGSAPVVSIAAAATTGLTQLSVVGSSGLTTINVLVGADGRAYVFSSDGTRAIGAAGTLLSGSLLNVTLPDQSRLSVTFADSGIADGTLTPAGGTAQRVLGAAEGVAVGPRMINMSARGRTSTGNNILISGFVVTGSAPKRLVVRVAGPVLANFDVPNVLQNPNLTIYNSAGASVATNDDWSTQSPANPDILTQMIAAGGFSFGANSRDAAIVVRLAPGSYTVHAGGGDGTVLTEIYELLDSDEVAGQRRIVNFSARGQVSVAGEPLTAGFAIVGNLPRRVLIRGIGPGIAPFVPNAVANPRVRIFRGQTVLKENDDWFRDPDAAQISAAAQSVNAFTLGSVSLDAALLIVLEPGTYTAVVDNVSGATGVGLVEVYELP